MKGQYNKESIERLSDVVFKGLTPYFYHSLDNEGKRIWTKKIDEAKEFVMKNHEVTKTIIEFPKEMYDNLCIHNSICGKYVILTYWK